MKVTKTLRKVAVLLGGRSEEREISLLTGRAVANALQRQNCDVKLIDWQGRDSIEQLLSEQYDCAFIALHGIDGEDGSVQSLLEILDIPYTGSGVLASALCMDKIKTKRVLQSNNLPVLPDEVVTVEALSDENKIQQNIDRLIDKLGFPLCVKPINQGSSIGTYRADNRESLRKALIDAGNFGEQIMIEPWLTGPEYTVGFLNNNPLPSIRIAPNREFYDYDAKYLSHDTSYHCPSGLDEATEQEVKDLATRAFTAASCYDWGRVDFVTDNNGQFYILEINTIPGLTDTSLVPKAAASIGVTFDALVLQITVNAALKQNLNSNINKSNKGSKGGQVLA